MKDQKKNWKKGLGILAINLLFTFIGLESISLVYYSLKEKQFFYKRVTQEEKLREELERTGIRLSDSVLERLHPYFGYVLKQGAFPEGKAESGLYVNRLGFFSRYEYPYRKKSDRELVIGVFGGSVAVDFSNTEALFQSISKRLKQYPQFANKEIIVLNFAHGGFKQPQQVLILNYMLAIGQKFDAVVNIDGFNEVALGNLNNQAGEDVSMPSIQQMQSLSSLADRDLSPKLVSAIARVNETKTHLKNTLDTLDKCPIALCYAVNYIQVNDLVKDYQRAVKKFNDRVNIPAATKKSTDSIVVTGGTKTTLPDDQAYAKMVDNWYESSLLMHQVLQTQNTPYLHFIQPNQYYPSQRIFTQEELQKMVKKESPFVPGVVKGYPLLLARLEQLQQAQVNAFSAVELFDNEKDTIYRDDCCHYNKVGRKMLSNFVADRIANIWETRK